MLLGKSPLLLRYPEPRPNPSSPVSFPRCPLRSLADDDQTFGVIPRCPHLCFCFPSPSPLFLPRTPALMTRRGASLLAAYGIPLCC